MVRGDTMIRISPATEGPAPLPSPTLIAQVLELESRSRTSEWVHRTDNRLECLLANPLTRGPTRWWLAWHLARS